ncbi:MAG: hypothetical protein ACRDT8_09845 [Micromonosporaceae bacterium]
MTAAAPAKRPWGGAAERERLARILQDPKTYFVEARRWAEAKAREDVQRDLEGKARKRRSGQ